MGNNAGDMRCRQSFICICTSTTHRPQDAKTDRSALAERVVARHALNASHSAPSSLVFPVRLAPSLWALGPAAMRPRTLAEPVRA